MMLSNCSSHWGHSSHIPQVPPFWCTPRTFHLKHPFLSVWGISLVPMANIASKSAGILTPPDEVSVHDRRGDYSFLTVQVAHVWSVLYVHCLPEVCHRNEPQWSMMQTCLLTQPALASLPYFLTRAFQDLPVKLLAFNFFSQGLFLEAPYLSH